MKERRRELWVLGGAGCGKDIVSAFRSWQNPCRRKWNFPCIINNAYICLKEKKKSWEASRWRVLMRKKRSVVSRTLGNCSKTVHPYAETVPVRSPAAALARVSTGCALGRAWDWGFGTWSWLQQEMWVLGISQGLAVGMGKVKKQVCSKACRRNYISFGITPLPPQGKQHPVTEWKLPGNGRKANGRTASARLIFALCQKEKKKKVWFKIHQAKETQEVTGPFSLVSRHPFEGGGNSAP